MLKILQKRIHLPLSWTHIIIIIIILIGLTFRYFFYFGQSISEGMNNVYDNEIKHARGYCDKSAEYVLPVTHSDFLTSQEADYILQMAKTQFSDSQIVTGSDTNIRKSKTAWLSKTDPTIKTIIQRVCDMTNIPFENAEKMQVVHYEPNGYYNEHHDACCDDRQECIDFEKNGGQRKITMLIYLSDDFEGGATRFPNLDKEYKLPKYSGLLFHPLEKNGNKGHPLALHAGMPVTSGNKYIANVWLREREYDAK